MERSFKEKADAYRATVRTTWYGGFLFIAMSVMTLPLAIVTIRSPIAWEYLPMWLFAGWVFVTIVVFVATISRAGIISRAACDMVDAATPDDYPEMERLCGSRREFKWVTHQWCIHRFDLDCAMRFQNLQRYTTAKGCECAFWDTVYEARPELAHLSVIRCSPT
jgi:hypothetical protein